MLTPEEVSTLYTNLPTMDERDPDLVAKARSYVVGLLGDNVSLDSIAVLANENVYQGDDTTFWFTVMDCVDQLQAE